MPLHGLDLFLQIHDFLLQPCDGHGLGDDEQVALIGRGFIGERLRLQHDLRIGLPPCDGAFDALAAHDLRIESRAGEDAGRSVAPQILRHATHLEIPRIGDAVHRCPLHRGQGVEVVDLRLCETTFHDVPLMVWNRSASFSIRCDAFIVFSSFHGSLPFGTKQGILA